MSLQPTRYTFGCMSLGHDLALCREHVAVVREAMDAGVWFHASPTYNRGFCFMILRMAFDQDRSRVPAMIVKIRDGSPELMRFEAEDACRRLGIDGVDVVQLVSMDRGENNLVAQLRTGGPLADELGDLRRRGVIRRAVVFVDRQNSEDGLDAQGSELVDGLTCYWNAGQREMSTAVWETVQRSDVPVLALRTLIGGPANERWRAARAKAMEIARRMGCGDEVEFAVRLAASHPCIRTTIGGTQNRAHLRHYLECAASPAPLPADVLQAIEALRSSDAA